jgi:hypothetical protein
MIDDYADFVPLIEYHLERGRSVYLPDGDLQDFHSSGGQLPAGYRVSPVMTEGATTILEIHLPPAAE